MIDFYENYIYWNTTKTKPDCRRISIWVYLGNNYETVTSVTPLERMACGSGMDFIDMGNDLNYLINHGTK